MADKKIIDDYYSNLNQNSADDKAWESSDTSTKAKPKIKKVIKKKVIKKKVEEKDNLKVKEDNNTKKVEKNENKSKPTKKKIIQKIEVVKEEPVITSKIEEKVESKEVEVSELKASKKKSFKQKKNFKDKWNDNNENFEKWWKKSKLKPAKKSKTRWKLKFFEEEKQEKGFVRSNKIAKKQKEEKKVEDIKQNLVSHKWETVVVPEVLTLKEFSEKIW